MIPADIVMFGGMALFAIAFGLGFLYGRRSGLEKAEEAETLLNGAVLAGVSLIRGIANGEVEVERVVARDTITPTAPKAEKGE